MKYGFNWPSGFLGNLVIVILYKQQMGGCGGGGGVNRPVKSGRQTFLPLLGVNAPARSGRGASQPLFQQWHIRPSSTNSRERGECTSYSRPPRSQTDHPYWAIKSVTFGLLTPTHFRQLVWTKTLYCPPPRDGPPPSPARASGLRGGEWNSLFSHGAMTCFFGLSALF